MSSTSPLRYLIKTLLPGKVLKYGYLKPRKEAILLDDLKLIYFPISKVANRSIKEALAAKTRKSGKVSAHKYDWNYISLKQACKSEHFSFAFVRNPLDRLVSCYVQKSKGGGLKPIFWKYGNEIREDMSFQEFADFVCNTSDQFADRHFKSQHCFVLHKQKLMVDFLGRFESLAEDWQRLRLQFDLPALPHRNKSSKNRLETYYDKDLAIKVAKRYKKDIELFDYQKEVAAIIKKL